MENDFCLETFFFYFWNVFDVDDFRVICILVSVSDLQV
jgi:hypothetical protein